MLLLATAILFYFQHVSLNSFSCNFPQQKRFHHNFSIHGPDDSEFDFRTAMNIWGKLRKRHILVEKAKESKEKSKLLKKIVMKSLLLRKITRERIKRDMLKIK
jgi:hypothetical protein